MSWARGEQAYDTRTTFDKEQVYDNLIFKHFPTRLNLPVSSPRSIVPRSNGKDLHAVSPGHAASVRE